MMGMQRPDFNNRKARGRQATEPTLYVLRRNGVLGTHGSVFAQRRNCASWRDLRIGFGTHRLILEFEGQAVQRHGYPSSLNLAVRRETQFLQDPDRCQVLLLRRRYETLAEIAVPRELDQPSRESGPKAPAPPHGSQGKGDLDLMSTQECTASEADSTNYLATSALDKVKAEPVPLPMLHVILQVGCGGVAFSHTTESLHHPRVRVDPAQICQISGLDPACDHLGYGELLRQRRTHKYHGVWDE